MPLLPTGAAPYLAPYAAFLALVELQSSLPNVASLLFPLRVLAPAALITFFWRGGAYPELRGYAIDTRTLADIAIGLAIAALWLAPYLLWPALPQGSAFDPEFMGEGRRALTLGLRLAGFALVTPFVEELFVRSFVLRFAEVFDRYRDFRNEPIARFAWRGFIVTALWFTFSHAPWEWLVALPTGIALNAWLYQRGHLVACVVAHATANAAIWALVVFAPLPLWAFL